MIFLDKLCKKNAALLVYSTAIGCDQQQVLLLDATPVHP